MITANEIILKLILQKGYKSLREFCLKNGIDYNSLRVNQRLNNSWTSEIIKKISNALGEDLSFLINAKVGREKKSYDTK